MQKKEAISTSERMRRVGRSNTSLEMRLRRWLWSRGYRYRVNDKALPGKPDIVFSKRRKIILAHGCFWHGHSECRRAKLPKTRTDYWREKISRNKVRDEKVLDKLRAAGWDILIVWECEVGEISKLRDKLLSFLGPTRHLSESDEI